MASAASIEIARPSVRFRGDLRCRPSVVRCKLRRAEREEVCVTVIDWLLDSDPSVRWQMLRDLTEARADEIAAERARGANQGLGAQLLALQSDDGRWGGT